MKKYIIEILIITFIVLLVILGLSFAFHKKYKSRIYKLNFQDVDGIIKGSPVKFMGVTVGHVSDLKYENKEILATILITKRGINVPACSSAKVEFTGIVGSKSIEIMPPETTNCEEKIITQNPLRINEFFNSIQIYNRALEGIDNGLKKFSNENVEYILSKISKDPDFKVIDKIISNTDKIQGNITRTIQKAIKTEEKAIHEIEIINKRIPKY